MVDIWLDRGRGVGGRGRGREGRGGERNKGITKVFVAVFCLLYRYAACMSQYGMCSMRHAA